MKNLLATLLAAALLTLSLTSCRTPTDADNTIPWSRPANWEGGLPGMGMMPQQQQR